MYILSGPSCFYTKALETPYRKLSDLENSLLVSSYAARMAQTYMVLLAIRVVPRNSINFWILPDTGKESVTIPWKAHRENL